MYNLLLDECSFSPIFLNGIRLRTLLKVSYLLFFGTKVPPPPWGVVVAKTMSSSDKMDFSVFLTCGLGTTILFYLRKTYCKATEPKVESQTC